jgi:hypothetical protein
MAELGWKEAIVKVLDSSDEPMHYTDITQAIATEGLKRKVGATPAATVRSTISTSMQKEGENSPFRKISPGVYMLTSTKGTPDARMRLQEERKGEKLINAFGMYWQRKKVRWEATPRLFGKAQFGQLGGQRVDFCQQRGVYLLLDGSKTVYVGRTTDQALGLRLKVHISDRLNGRWDRFSWFGVLAVSDDGSLSSSPPEAFNIDNLIVTMEALLIEGLEPPQNRRRGDDLSDVEFIQVKDPDLQTKQDAERVEKLLKNLRKNP